METDTKVLNMDLQNDVNKPNESDSEEKIINSKGRRKQIGIIREKIKSRTSINQVSRTEKNNSNGQNPIDNAETKSGKIAFKMLKNNDKNEDIVKQRKHKNENEKTKNNIKATRKQNRNKEKHIKRGKVYE